MCCLVRVFPSTISGKQQAPSVNLVIFSAAFSQSVTFFWEADIKEGLFRLENCNNNGQKCVYGTKGS